MKFSNFSINSFLLPTSEAVTITLSSLIFHLHLKMSLYLLLSLFDHLIHLYLLLSRLFVLEIKLLYFENQLCYLLNLWMSDLKNQLFMFQLSFLTHTARKSFDCLATNLQVFPILSILSYDILSYLNQFHQSQICTFYPCFYLFKNSLQLLVHQKLFVKMKLGCQNNQR